MVRCHMIPQLSATGKCFYYLSYRMSSYLNASGLEKERWFGLRSTEKRLQDIQKFMDLSF